VLAPPNKDAGVPARRLFGPVEMPWGTESQTNRHVLRDSLKFRSRVRSWVGCPFAGPLRGRMRFNFIPSAYSYLRFRVLLEACDVHGTYMPSQILRAPRFNKVCSHTRRTSSLKQVTQAKPMESSEENFFTK
jgi:hypothetical protein